MTVQKTNCKPCMTGNCNECITENCLCREDHSKPESLNDGVKVILNSGHVKGDKSFLKDISRTHTISKGKKSYVLEILDKSIVTLRPITLLEDDTRMILVYLPTKTREIQEGDFDGPPEYSNRAFFVTTSEAESRSILPINSRNLHENFQIRIFEDWYQSRWNVKDMYAWQSEKDRTNPKILYELASKTTRKYLDFEEEHDYIYFDLWNIGTYFYELFDAYPYNDYTGTKRAGKSKAMEYQKLVCYNAIMSADSSGSAMFRIIEGTGATILLDETEQMKNQKNENAQHLRTLIMQGFLKDQFAIRNEGKTDSGFVPTTFNLYSPKSLAHINSFDDVLEDRCIQQLMRRSKDKEKLNSWPDERDPAFGQIRNLCYRFFLDHAHEIKELQNQTRKLLSVSGRELKLWTPIITLAKFFENHGCTGLVNHIQTKATQSSTDRQIQDEEENYDLKILRFLDEKALSIPEGRRKDNPQGWIPIGVIYEYLVESQSEYSINTEYFKRSNLTQTLRRLGLRQEKKVGGISWFITKDSIKDVKERMGLLPLPDGQTQLTSDASKSSESSVQAQYFTPETEQNEVSEQNEQDNNLVYLASNIEQNEQTELSQINKTSGTSEVQEDFVNNV